MGVYTIVGPTSLIGMKKKESAKKESVKKESVKEETKKTDTATSGELKEGMEIEAKYGDDWLQGKIYKTKTGGRVFLPTFLTFVEKSGNKNGFLQISLTFVEKTSF